MGAPLTRTNCILTLVVLVPPFGVASITQDVQAVVKYVGGYLGLAVAFLFPALLVFLGRRKLHLNRPDMAHLRWPLKSPFASRPTYVLVGLFLLAALSLTTKQLFFASAHT